MPPREGRYVTRIACHYAYPRQTQVKRKNDENNGGAPQSESHTHKKNRKNVVDSARYHKGPTVWASRRGVCNDPFRAPKPTPTDQGYGRGGTPIFTGVFEPLARVALHPTDEDGLGTWFAAA